MTTLAQRIGRALALWIAVAVVLAAVSVSLARLVLPQVASYRTEVAQWVGGVLNAHVRIGELGARWAGLDPQLVLNDVSVLNEDGRELLHFEQARVAVDLVATLRSWQVRPGSVELSGAKLEVHGRSLRDLTLQGDTADSGFSGSELLDWFASQTELRIQRSELLFHLDDGSPHTTAKVKLLRVVNDADRHQVDVEIDAGAAGRARLAADLFGPSDDVSAWHGQLYLRLDEVDPNPFLVLLPLPTLPLAVAQVSAELWGDWRDPNSAAIGGQLEIQQLRHPDSGISASLSSRVHAQWQTRVLGIGMEELSISRESSEIQLARAELAYHPGENEQPARVTLATTNLDVARLRQLLHGSLESMGEAAKWIEQAQPEGVVQSLNLSLPLTAEAELDLAQMTLHADFSAIGFAPVEEMPGITGLNGALAIAPGGGELRLDESALTLQIPKLLRREVALARSYGALSWRRDGDDAQGWRLQMAPIWLENSHVRGALLGDVLLHPERPLFLDIQAAFEEGVAEHARDYYPVAIIPPGLLGWLDSAFVDGDVTRGGFLLRGAAEGFPYTDASGRFQVLFEAENGVLDYFPEWPRVEQLAAEVEFSNDSLFVGGRSGKLTGMALHDVEARIPRLSQGATLHLLGQNSVDAGAALAFVQQSPLDELLGGIPGTLAAAGPVHLQLDMKLPIKTAYPRLDLRAQLQKTRLHYQPLDLAFTDLRGDLLITETGVAAKRIDGEFMGGPASLSALHFDKPHGGVAGAVLEARGSGLDVPALSSRLPIPVASHLAGVANWQAELGFRAPGAGAPPEAWLRGASNLVGVAVNLPAPVRKAPETAQTFRFDWDLSPLPERKLTMQAGELALDLRFRDAGEGLAVQRGGVGYAMPLPTLDDGGGVSLHAQAAGFSLSEWRRAFAGEQGEFDAWRFFREVDLRLDSLELYGFEDQQVTLRGSRDEHQWRGAISGQRAVGAFSYPLDPQAGPSATLVLGRLHLPPGDGEESYDESSPDPRELPGFSVNIADFRLQDSALGELQAEVVRQPWGLQLVRGTTRHKHFELDLTGAWRITGDAHRSDLNVEVRSGNLGEMFQVWGFAKTMRKGAANATARMQWDDAPARFSLRKVTGNGAFFIADGSLLDVDPGAARLLGLLSVYTLPQRLLLDFSDMLTEGFSFKTIEGEVTLRDGSAFSDKMSLDGPAARMEFVGRVGLVDEDYDQEVRVVPRVSGALPLVGVLAGGTPVGAVMLFLQTLFGDSVDEGSEIRYKVTGPWDKPDVVQLARPEVKVDPDLIK